MDHTHVVLLPNEPQMSLGMPHCRDCQWWEVAGATHFWVGRGYCRKLAADDSSPTDPKQVAIATAHEDGGTLVTPPDFGCVQFEPREP